MRCLSLLMLLALSGTSCASGSCKVLAGIDRHPPRLVLLKLQKDFPGYKLVDRRDCQREILWLAIPASMDPKARLAPGVGKLVTFDKRSKEINIFHGE